MEDAGLVHSSFAHQEMEVAEIHSLSKSLDQRDEAGYELASGDNLKVDVPGAKSRIPRIRKVFVRRWIGNRSPAGGVKTMAKNGSRKIGDREPKGSIDLGRPEKSRELPSRGGNLTIPARSKMEPKRYIVWSTKKVDLDDPWQRKWYIRQVLTHGRAEDIAELDWEEVRSVLKEIVLPSPVRRLWESYFGA